MRSHLTARDNTLPEFLHDLAHDLAVGGVRVDRHRLAIAIAALELNSDNLDRDKRRALQAYRALHHLKGDIYRTDLRVSQTSDSLNAAAPFSEHETLSGLFEAWPGRVLVDVEAETSPWRMLAHLSGDTHLQAAVDSGDVYQHIADKIFTTRAFAKHALFQLMWDADKDRMLASLEQLGTDALAARGAVERLVFHVDDAFGYMSTLRAYGHRRVVVQAAANRAAGRTLAYAHTRATDAGGRAAVLFDQGSLLYEVDADKVDHFCATLKHVRVFAEGILTPITVTVR